MIRVCTCCRTQHTALHAHDKPCAIHGLAPVVPWPPPLHLPGGEDCTGPTVKAAIFTAYRAQGGVALELALKMYGESDLDTATPLQIGDYMRWESAATGRWIEGDVINVIDSDANSITFRAAAWDDGWTELLRPRAGSVHVASRLQCRRIPRPPMT